MKLMLREQHQQPTTPDYCIESIRGLSAPGNEAVNPWPGLVWDA